MEKKNMIGGDTSTAGTAINAALTKLCHDDNLQLTVNKNLGEPGGFGTVYEATNGYGIKIAVKEFRSHQLDESGRKQSLGPFTKQQILNEIIACDALGVSERVVGAPVGYPTNAELNGEISGDVKYVLMEYAGSQDLFARMDTQKRAFTENEAISYIYDLLMGLKELHDKGWAHRDIKLENIVVSNVAAKGGPRPPSCRIIDVGFAVKVNDSDSVSLFNCGDIMGTCKYAAPELVTESYLKLGNKFDCRKADIFAAGACLYTMVMREYLFDDRRGKGLGGKDRDEVRWREHYIPYTVNKIVEEKVENSTELSLNIIYLLKGMLNPIMEERWDADQCLGHELFNPTIEETDTFGDQGVWDARNSSLKEHRKNTIRNEFPGETSDDLEIFIHLENLINMRWEPLNLTLIPGFPQATNTLGGMMSGFRAQIIDKYNMDTDIFSKSYENLGLKISKYSEYLTNLQKFFYANCGTWMAWHPIVGGRFGNEEMGLVESEIKILYKKIGSMNPSRGYQCFGAQTSTNQQKVYMLEDFIFADLESKGYGIMFAGERISPHIFMGWFVSEYLDAEAASQGGGGFNKKRRYTKRRNKKRRNKKSRKKSRKKTKRRSTRYKA